MDPIDVLMDEHQTILEVLDAMDGYAARINDQGADPADLRGFTDFLRGFADTYHHGKEEEILFTSLVANGFPRDSGPIAVMLYEHEESRKNVRALVRLAELADRPAAWDDAERIKIATYARSYSSLLRSHIEKEDHILYPMARRHLPAPQMEGIRLEFDSFEEQQCTTGRPSELRALAGRLVSAYGRTAGKLDENSGKADVAGAAS